MHMNARHVIIASLIALAGAVTLIVYPDIFATLFALIFIGVVPGTSLTIPSWLSLGIMTLLLIVAIRWVFDTPVYRPQATTQDLARRAGARRKVLKHASSRRHTPTHKTARAKVA